MTIDFEHDGYLYVCEARVSDDSFGYEHCGFRGTHRCEGIELDDFRRCKVDANGQEIGEWEACDVTLEQEEAWGLQKIAANHLFEIK